jgi:signal transduction histidine kinase
VTARRAGAWDRTRLGQVISNLVANALQLGASGTVEVFVGAEATRATLSVENAARDVAPDIVASMFEPFHRGSGGGRPQNMGLGLYIVEQLVDAHGGTVSARCHEGRMRVSITLPRTPSQP